MQATEHTIQGYLSDLAFAPNNVRLKSEFQGSKYTEQEAFIVAGNQLKFAYFAWRYYRSEVGTLSHLANAKDICVERLSSEYLRKYNDSVSYFEGILSRSSTPVHQDAHMKDLLLRLTASLH